MHARAGGSGAGAGRGCVVNEGRTSTPSSTQPHHATHANRVIRDVRHAAIDSTACLVLFVLASRLNADGEAWPSYEQLAGDCRLDRRTVVSVVSFLREIGVLVVETKRGRTANVYSIDLCRLTSLPPDIKPRRSRQPGSMITDTVVEDHGSTVVNDLGSCAVTVIVDPSTGIDDHPNRDRGSRQPGSTITRRYKEAVIEQPKEAERAQEGAGAILPEPRPPTSQSRRGTALPAPERPVNVSVEQRRPVATPGACGSLKELSWPEPRPPRPDAIRSVDDVKAVLWGQPLFAPRLQEIELLEHVLMVVMNLALTPIQVLEAVEAFVAGEGATAKTLTTPTFANRFGVYLRRAKTIRRWDEPNEAESQQMPRVGDLPPVAKVGVIPDGAELVAMRARRNR